MIKSLKYPPLKLLKLCFSALTIILWSKLDTHCNQTNALIGVSYTCNTYGILPRLYATTSTMYNISMG